MACELEEGLAVLHQPSGTFYVLGEVETFIWNQLESPATSDDVAMAVGEAYDAPHGDVAADVRAFLESMVDADLFRPHVGARA